MDDGCGGAGPFLDLLDGAGSLDLTLVVVAVVVVEGLLLEALVLEEDLVLDVLTFGALVLEDLFRPSLISTDRNLFLWRIIFSFFSSSSGGGCG